MCTRQNGKVHTKQLFQKNVALFWNFLDCIVSVFSLLTRSRAQRANAVQELRDREEVEKELSIVKAWIQETRELLLNPTQDIDSLLQELEVYSSHHSKHDNMEICCYVTFEKIDRSSTFCT